VKRDAIVIRAEDNVATAIRNLEAGYEAAVGIGEDMIRLKLYQSIDFGHKMAIRDIALGEKILKYASVIGKATRSIKAGEHVHVHNVESLRGRGDLHNS
jgi:altronate dehydratase small subunit